jgi:hypothetical protein
MAYSMLLRYLHQMRCCLRVNSWAAVRPADPAAQTRTVPSRGRAGALQGCRPGGAPSRAACPVGRPPPRPEDSTRRCCHPCPPQATWDGSDGAHTTARTCPRRSRATTPEGPRPPHDHLVKEFPLHRVVELVPGPPGGQPAQPVAQCVSGFRPGLAGFPAEGSGQVVGDQVGSTCERLLIDPHQFAFLGHGLARPILPINPHCQPWTSAPAASCPISHQPQAFMQHAGKRQSGFCGGRIRQRPCDQSARCRARGDHPGTAAVRSGTTRTATTTAKATMPQCRGSEAMPTTAVPDSYQRVAQSRSAQGATRPSRVSEPCCGCRSG